MVKRPKAKGDGTDIWMHSKMKPVDFHLLILESIYFLFFSLSPFIFILNNTAEIMQSYYTVQSPSLHVSVLPETKADASSAGCGCNM